MGNSKTFVDDVKTRVRQSRNQTSGNKTNGHLRVLVQHGFILCLDAWLLTQNCLQQHVCLLSQTAQAFFPSEEIILVTYQFKGAFWTDTQWVSVRKEDCWKECVWKPRSSIQVKSCQTVLKPSCAVVGGSHFRTRETIKRITFGRRKQGLCYAPHMSLHVQQRLKRPKHVFSWSLSVTWGAIS